MSSTPHNLSQATTLDEVVNAHLPFLAAIDAGQSVTQAAMAAYGWDLQAPEPAMLLAQIDQIVVRRLTAFRADNETPLILDCGANVGISALEFKRQAPGARIVAFEPDPVIGRQLRANLARNGAGDVDVVESAVWTAAGTVRFVTTGGDGGRVVDDDSSGITVSTIDLRDYLRGGVDLLKLDIEGAEYAVVAHIEPLLDHVKNLIVECHIDQTRLTAFSDLVTRIRNAGFTVSFNTFGHWRDLTRWPAVERMHFEQYVAVYGSRGSLPVQPSSSLPYVEFPVLLEHYRHQHAGRGPSAYQAAMTGQAQTSEHTRLHPPFTHVSGECWTVRLPEHVPAGDSLAYPGASRLILFEDRVPLGPPHAEHATIAKFGGGRFSHWQNFLYFSTLDGSDPNSNGRAYAVAINLAGAER
jgi:FkbM family methyltransferase